MTEAEVPISVRRETVKWESAFLHHGSVEDRKKYDPVVIYHVEAGWTKVVYRKGQKRRVPAWAAEALEAAFGVSVPAALVKP